MRKYTLSILILMGYVIGYAHNAVKFTNSEALETIFMLSDNPRVTVGENTFIVETAKDMIEYEISADHKFEFVNYSESSVSVIEADSPIFKFNGGSIDASNLTPGMRVTIADMAGKIIFSHKADESGNISIDCSNYPVGVYIFSSKDQNFKFYKR